MKNLKMFFLVSIMLLLFTTPVYAHKLAIESVEDGIIKVHYDDGSFSEKTEIILYDANDKEIKRGKLDENGQFKYDKDSGVVYIVADDGMGHKVKWKVGEEVSHHHKGSKWIKIGGVLIAFAAVGGIFYKRKDKNVESA
ncbi:MAG: hypothetical protein AB2417_03510 [Clostridiaceae bacterium]